MSNITGLTTAEILAFKSLSGVGTKTVKALGDSGLSFEEILYASPDELKRIVRTGPTYKALIDGLQSISVYQAERMEQNLIQMEGSGISTVNYWDSAYPSLLKLLLDAPPVIYLKGNLALLESTSNVAIVGTRECSRHGARIAASTAKEFSKRGYGIVSGLAKGIDTEAHRGALEISGPSIAVLVDLVQIYPAENQGLAHQIVDQGGLLVAENYPGENLGRNAFVSRDRIQSGMALGVFVIETGIKGGTMHTVKFATHQGRLLYCPDFSKVPNYEFNSGQHGGVEHLLSSAQAKPYTGKDYQNIHVQLNRQMQKLTSERAKTNLFG